LLGLDEEFLVMNHVDNKSIDELFERIAKSEGGCKSKFWISAKPG
jgi:hypothetical protein